MLVIRSAQEIRGFAARFDRATVLVPTMGALHPGHAALITLAAEHARARGLVGGAVAYIFVNPSQFNDPKDFEKYPRIEEHDLAVCERAGASCVVIPPAEVVYPPDDDVQTPALPAIADGPGLEDSFRPGHFAGVARVIKRFFELLRPAAAVFGEKDWQQLVLVTTMTRDLGLGVEIIPGPTYREPDGLAMSSRNLLLSPEARERALAINRALRRAGGQADPGAAESAMRQELAGAGIEPEYAVVRDAETLLAVRPGRPARALIAAVVGGVRLIDNMAWRG